MAVKKNEADFFIRLNSELKDSCVDLFNDNNITLTDVIKSFIEESVKNNRLPFDRKAIIVGKSLEKNGSDVKKIHIRMNDPEMLEQFKEICENMCISYSMAIKIYLDLCLTERRIVCEKDMESDLYNNRKFTRFEKNEKE